MTVLVDPDDRHSLTNLFELNIRTRDCNFKILEPSVIMYIVHVYFN